MLKNTSLLTGVIVNNEVVESQILKRISFFMESAALPGTVNKIDLIGFYKKSLESCLKQGQFDNDNFLENLKNTEASRDAVSYISYCSNAFLEPVDTLDNFIF